MKQAVKQLLSKYIGAFQQWLDLSVAILLLTGQFTVRSVILTADAYFSLSLSGPILGGPRAQPVTEGASFVLDSIDVILALLLILGEVNVSGMFIQSQRFTLLVGGPPFGGPKSTPYVPSAEEFFSDFREQILSRFEVQQPNQRK